VRVNQAQSLEAHGRRAESFQRGNQNAFVVADDDGVYFTLAADEQADLPVDLAGDEG